MDDRLITTEELCDWIRVSKNTVFNWRASGEGPPAILCGGRTLRWRESDVLKWLDDNTQAAAV